MSKGNRFRNIAISNNDLPIALNGNQTSSGQLDVYNPTTGKIIGYASSKISDYDIQNIENSARKSQKIWFHEVSEQEKEAVFRAIIDQLEKHRGILARTMVLESGKLWRWADAEITETIDTFWHYHGEISRSYSRYGFSRCQMADKNAFSVRKPYGLFLAITPWNFPLAVPFWKICSQLAGGNAVVVKDAEQTPFTLSIAVELIHRAIENTLGSLRASELNGLVQLVHGAGDVGAYLVDNLNYDKLSFTGSAEVGAVVSSVASKRLKPSYLELGGHAAMVVLDDFDVDLAVSEAINANLGDSGQRCVSTRVVFVQENIYEEFLKKYIRTAEKRVMGDPMDFKTEMGPLVSKEQFERVRKQVKQTERLLGMLGMHAKFNVAVPNNDGYYYPPTVFTDIPYGVTAMGEEIFGPVIVINSLTGKNRKEAFGNAVELVNKAKQGLSNALLTNDRLLASRAPWVFESGIFYIGRGTTGAELNKGFGGIKKSGWGREGRGIDETTYEMQVYDDYRGKARMAQAGADHEVKKVFSNAKSPLES